MNLLAQSFSYLFSIPQRACRPGPAEPSDAPGPPVNGPPLPSMVKIAGCRIPRVRALARASVRACVRLRVRADTHTLARAHTHKHTHTHAQHARTRTHAHTRARAHTHTHTHGRSRCWCTPPPRFVPRAITTRIIQYCTSLYNYIFQLFIAYIKRTFHRGPLRGWGGVGG